MKGHLHLTCARGSNGANHVREQSFRAPLHLSKPHEDEDALVVNIVNPTAGIFDDDEIEMNVRVEPGARLVLTTPSSSRVYRSRNGGHAKVKQTLSVGQGAFLEYYPEPFIPHAGARYAQQNILNVDAGGSMIFFEWLAPGRVASGEVFRYEELRWDTDVTFDSQLIARERYTLRTDDASLSALKLGNEAAHYVGCFVVGDFPWPNSALDELNNGDVYLGFGPLAHGGWTIKAICSDALHARRTMVALREVLYRALSKPAPSLGRF